MGDAWVPCASTDGPRGHDLPHVLAPSSGPYHELGGEAEMRTTIRHVDA